MRTSITILLCLFASCQMPNNVTESKVTFKTEYQPIHRYADGRMETQAYIRNMSAVKLLVQGYTVVTYRYEGKEETRQSASEVVSLKVGQDTVLVWYTANFLRDEFVDIVSGVNTWLDY